jgi:hypothetical protein
VAHRQLLWTADGLAFAPVGQTLVSGSGYSRDIRFWRTAHGAPLPV